MRQATPKEALEKAYIAFSEIETSEAYWNVFAQIVAGNNYTSSIAKKLRKNKSIVSRQLQKLHRMDIVVQIGTGVKQLYEINWVPFTTYWIWFANTFVELFGQVSLKQWAVVPQRTPDWLSEFYLTAEEERLVGKKTPPNVEPLLEPITPQLSEVVRRIVEVLAQSGDVRTFFEAFREISIAFAAGLPDVKYVDSKKIDIAHNKQLIETLYNPRVRVWLKILALQNLASSNIVRNHILRLAGVITTDEIAALRPQT